MKIHYAPRRVPTRRHRLALSIAAALPLLLWAGMARARASCISQTDGNGNPHFACDQPSDNGATKARLDRIEALLKAICERQAFAGGAPDCPK